MSKKTLTIGIPALNEEANIGFLIDALFKQHYGDLQLVKIIVVSDGSTDGTVKVLKSLNKSKLTVIDRKERQGALATQNEIVTHTDEDILILLDADVLPKGRNFISEITAPMLQDKRVGLVGADTISLPANTFFEDVIAKSHEFKKSIYYKINNGNNVYMCHGRARAFSRVFYKKLKWGKESPEDAYSYLECIAKGYRFEFAKKAAVYFRSPSTFADHAKQSVRFEQGRKKLAKQFGENFVSREYRLSTKLVLNKLLLFLSTHPLQALAYIAIKFYLEKVGSKKQLNLTSWEVAKSSKKLK